MSMSHSQVLAAARGLLAQYARECQVFDRINSAMRPWSRQEIINRFGILKNKNANLMIDRQIQLARDSQTMYLPLVLDTFAQSMKVEDYFSGVDAGARARAWKHWQRNNLDARQTGITRAALQYGTSYAVVDQGVVGGNAAPLITGVSPRHMTAYYGEAYAWPGESGVASEWPILALEVKGNRMRLFDEEKIYYIGAIETPQEIKDWAAHPWNTAQNLQLIEARDHTAGVPPVVRFRDRWLLEGEEVAGIIEPLIALQSRIDRTSWEAAVAQYYSAFKQRYVVGWAPDDDAEGIRMRASDVWLIDADAKVGQFDETDIRQYVDVKQASIRDMAAIAQVPAQSLGANAISNVSADGLAAMESAKDRKSSEIRTSLGESYEQLLRLCAHLDGDQQEAADFASEVKWADMTARSFAQTVDALGKLATMLSIPPEILWEDIPGFTAEKIKRIKQTMTRTPGFDAFDATAEPPLGDTITR